MSGESDGPATGEKRAGDILSSPFDNKSRKTVRSPPGGIFMPPKGVEESRVSGMVQLEVPPLSRERSYSTDSVGSGGSISSSVGTMASALSDAGVDREPEVTIREVDVDKEGERVDYGAEIGSSLRHFLSQPASGISKAAALVIMNKYAELEKLSSMLYGARSGLVSWRGKWRPCL